ncbi:MAG: hypothetical protein ACO3C1_09365 [Ilumatobacteraceae bacterium]
MCDVATVRPGSVADEFPPGLVVRERLIAVQQIPLMAINGSAMQCKFTPETARLDWRPASTLVMQAVLTDA